VQEQQAITRETVCNGQPESVEKSTPVAGLHAVSP